MFLDEFDHIIKISIHALREESDELSMRSSSGGSKFQSTPSARRATCWICSHREHHYNFNPRPPRGERPSESRCRTCGI